MEEGTMDTENVQVKQETVTIQASSLDAIMKRLQKLEHEQRKASIAFEEAKKPAEIIKTNKQINSPTVSLPILIKISETKSYRLVN